jgi:putative tricarboxylic transport membrane protein
MEVFTFGITQLVMSFIGVVIGIVFGALPGMTATMAIAIFLPLTYAYDLTTSLFLLLGLYVGGISGGLIPAILINIPALPPPSAQALTVFRWPSGGKVSGL